MSSGPTVFLESCGWRHRPVASALPVCLSACLLGGSGCTGPFRVFSSSVWARGRADRWRCAILLLRFGIQRIILDLVCIPSGPQPAQPRLLILGSGRLGAFDMLTFSCSPRFASPTLLVCVIADHFLLALGSGTPGAAGKTTMQPAMRGIEMGKVRSIPEISQEINQEISQEIHIVSFLSKPTNARNGHGHMSYRLAPVSKVTCCLQLAAGPQTSSYVCVLHVTCSCTRM